MITFRPATRQKVGLVIGVMGPTGSGKSLTALLLARGLAALPGEDLADRRMLAEIDARVKALDTEAGRLLHYAPPPGQLPDEFTFGFLHGDFLPSYAPLVYRDNIMALSESCTVGMIDSFSHSWDGEGGQHDMQEEDLAAILAKPNAPAEDKISALSWKRAKMDNRKMISKLLLCRCHLVICLRAEEKLHIEQTLVDPTGPPTGRKKTVFIRPQDLPESKRWTPNCEKRLPYELTISLLLSPDKPGVPIPIKLEEQHRAFVPLDRPITAEVGRRLAEWARGGAAPPKPPEQLPLGWEEWTVEQRGINRAQAGVAALEAWWLSLPKSERQVLRLKKDEWKTTAQEKDAERP